MNTASGGWTSHKVRSDDYEAIKRAAIQQSQSNQYVQGVQAALEDPGASISGTRGVYGDTNVKPGDLFSNNFSQEGSAVNTDVNDIENRTGSMLTQASSTIVPQKDAEDMNGDEVERRLGMMSKGGQGFPKTHELNNQVRSV